jgi:predicted nucleotide-binding protein
MNALSNLIEKGNKLLEQVVASSEGRLIEGDLVTEIKSLHIQGRFLLKKIDKVTFQDYSNLFSRHVGNHYDWQNWNQYIKTELESCLGILKAVEEVGIEKALDTSIINIFISHGKFGPAFEKLEIFIRALGCSPIYDTEEPTEGRRINEHVEHLFKQADFYVILATIETTNEKGERLPNHNVTIELDRLTQSHIDKMLVLCESGCKMPSMVQDVIHAPFESTSMDIAFTKLVAELKRHDLL